MGVQKFRKQILRPHYLVYGGLRYLCLQNIHLKTKTPVDRKPHTQGKLSGTEAPSPLHLLVEEWQGSGRTLGLGYFCSHCWMTHLSPEVNPADPFVQLWSRSRLQERHGHVAWTRRPFFLASGLCFYAQGEVCGRNQTVCAAMGPPELRPLPPASLALPFLLARGATFGQSSPLEGSQFSLTCSSPFSCRAPRDSRRAKSVLRQDQPREDHVLNVQTE